LLTAIAEVLKQPLETAISIHTDDFEDFHVQEKMHIVISVKDFKAIVTHAETLRGPISAHFSYPTRPLQFSYQNFGIHCVFTLMTTGDYREASSTPAPKFISTRSSSRQTSAVPPPLSRTTSEMPPPARPAISKPLSGQSQRTSLRERIRQPSATTAETETDPDPDPDSLFMPGGDDDQTWDPPNYDNDEEEMLGWDASAENPNASFRPALRGSRAGASQDQDPYEGLGSQEGLPPTQRLSQVSRGGLTTSIKSR
jgi:cell cycle checkpoint control protein RAD9A